MTAPGSVAEASAWHMYRALVGVGLMCALLIVGVYEATRPIIAANRAQARQQAIFEVLQGARTTAAFAVEPDGRFVAVAEPVTGRDTVWAAYGEAGDLLGVAIEASGMGYQDTIRVLYGYSIADEAIVGIEVLESRETPGLGDKIETDPAFARNFERLDVSLGPDKTAIAHPIEAVGPGDKASPWQVDTITGATISSTAIADILRQSSTHWVSRIHGRQEDFRPRG